MLPTCLPFDLLQVSAGTRGLEDVNVVAVPLIRGNKRKVPKRGDTGRASQSAFSEWYGLEMEKRLNAKNPEVSGKDGRGPQRILHVWDFANLSEQLCVLCV
jgi:hypothetical protein